jgi:hypothetical protein
MTAWRPVVGYEGLYEVSDIGEVRSAARQGTAGGIRAPHLNRKTGYLQLPLWRDNRQVQRRIGVLVLEAFVGPRPPDHECRHVDCDKLNNRLENLAWGTSAENKADTAALGRAWYQNR